MKSGELRARPGPAEPHPSAGATLVTARPPLVAFNLELDTPNPEVARAVAAELREAGGGLPGVRALGLPREGERAQVSINVHDPIGGAARPGGRSEISRLAAEHGARPVEAELVGLAPEAALRGLSGRARRSATSTPARDRAVTSIENVARLASDAMAQTKKKRRRKHRGTQGGRIDTRPAAAEPRNRAEAQARARKRRREEASPAARPRARAAELVERPQEGRRRRGPLLRAARRLRPEPRGRRRWSRS